MILEKLSQMQIVLDARIKMEHPLVNGEDRIGKKIFALQVELFELANELPKVFKFWSNKDNNCEKALFELVDCLHFLLSVGNDLGVSYGDITFGSIKEKDVLIQFISVSEKINILYKERNTESWVVAFEYILGLGEMLGFTEEQIEEGYMQKNEKNHVRQNNGY